MIMSGPRHENYLRVRALRDQGMPQKEISAVTGLSRSYVSGLLSDPDGSKELERKDSYRKPCPDCGKLMDGSWGPGEKASKHCADCAPRHAKVWTQEAIIDAIQRWASIHGKPPRATDWNTTLAGHNHEGFPSANSVYGTSGVFESWADAVESAGFPRPLRGVRGPHSGPRKPRVKNLDRARVIELARQELSYARIAEITGCSQSYAQVLGQRAGIHRGAGWHPGRPQTQEEPMANQLKRPYLVFEENNDGALTLLGETEQSSTAAAVEAVASKPGKYAAVATANLQRMTLASQLVASKVTQYDEETA